MLAHGFGKSLRSVSLKGKDMDDAVERAKFRNLTNQEKFQKLFKEDQEIDQSKEIDNYMEV